MIDLFKNPFALLDVTVQDSAEAIRQAAARAVAEGRLEAADAETAANMLLDPDARLEAEVSWLIGRSAPRVQKILDALRAPADTAERLALLDSIDGVARSNLAAHLCWVERGGVPVVRAMVEAQNEISPEAVFWLINGNRELSGFPPASEDALWTALESLEAQHCAAVCEAIAVREEHRKFMVRLFSDGWDPQGPANAFLVRVVAAYDAWYDAHLETIEKQLSGHISALMANSSDAKATKGIKKCLALWDEYSAPLQNPGVENRSVTKRAETMHSGVGGLCIFLARERWRFRAALQIAESLRYAFPDFPPVDLALPERLAALDPMLAQAPASGAPQDLAQTMMTLQKDIPALAKGLASGGFRPGDRSPAGALYTSFAGAMASAHGTPAGEGIWIMLRCLALELGVQHRLTEGAIGLLEGLLGQAEDHLLPSEVRRMLENDVSKLRHDANYRKLEAAFAKGRLRAAARMVEDLLLNPPGEAEHDALVQKKAAILEARARQGTPPIRWLVLVMGLLTLVVAVVLISVLFR